MHSLECLRGWGRGEVGGRRGGREGGLWVGVRFCLCERWLGSEVFIVGWCLGVFMVFCWWSANLFGVLLFFGCFLVVGVVVT